jgi:hypothetical protein
MTSQRRQTSQSGPALGLQQYYVKTFDRDNSFVREIRVLASTERDATLFAMRQLLSDEESVAEPAPFPRSS